MKCEAAYAYGDYKFYLILSSSYFRESNKLQPTVKKSISCCNRMKFPFENETGMNKEAENNEIDLG